MAKLAERQQQQAQQLEQFRKKTADVAHKLAASDSSAAETLLDAGDELDRRFTAGRMREAARQLEKNRIGRATDIQQQVLDDLAELVDILRQRGATDTETLLRKLRQEEQELAGLKKRQEELLEKVDRAPEHPDSNQRKLQLQKLAKEQQQLHDDVAQMARRLRRLQARRSSDAAGRAASRMQQARQRLQKSAGRQAAGDQREALEDLQQAQRELARERREAEMQLAQELLERIADELGGMIAREQQVVDETARLDNQYKQRGNWSRTQLKSLRNLAEVQQGLKQETDRLVETLKAAEVFALALKGASRQMQTAADRLSRRETDNVTITAERAAKQRFVDLIAALETEKPNDAAQPTPSNGGGADGQPPQDGIPQLAQLKMLKTLQEDINRRTLDLDAIRQRTGRLTSGQQAESDALVAEQGQLADLARNLTRAVTETFETEPDGNDVRKTDEENR